MYFTYQGGESEDAAPGGVRDVWGVKFPRGECVEVKDSALAKKLSNLAGFKESAPDKPEPAPAKKKTKKKAAKKASAPLVDDGESALD